MRGYESEEEEDESDSESEPEVSVIEPVSSAPEWGTNSTAPGWGNSFLTSSSNAPEWGSTESKSEAPTWGSSSVAAVDQASAEEWTERSRQAQRLQRSEEIKRGNSPPPKFREENLFIWIQIETAPSFPQCWIVSSIVDLCKHFAHRLVFCSATLFTPSPVIRLFSCFVDRPGIDSRVSFSDRIVERPWANIESGSEDSSGDDDDDDGVVERPKEDNENDSEESSGDDDGEGHLNEMESSSVVPHSPARGECIMSTASALQKFHLLLMHLTCLRHRCFPLCCCFLRSFSVCFCFRGHFCF
jgi:hypothetical protein